MSTEILGYFSETDFSLVSADVFRPRGDWNTRFCSRNTFFFLFPLYIGLFQYSLFLIFLFHYRTGKYVVIVRFYTTHNRLLPSVCEIYAPLCKIKQIQELYFFHSFNQFILLFSFSSIDRLVTINFLWTVASQLVRPNTPHPVSLQYSSVCSSSMKAFWSFVVLGHSLVLLLRLRSFPPTTYSVTRLGKTEFLVPFSCLHQAVLSSFPNKTFVDKVSKGNKWSRQVRILSEHCWEVKSLLKLP